MNDIELLEEILNKQIKDTEGTKRLKQAIENLINRVKELEENNKKLQEGYDKRVREILKLEQRIEELEEIEEEHRKENGKLREKIKELEKENREIRDWKYVIDSYEDLDKLKELDLIKIKGKEYISKDKIKEKIENYTIKSKHPLVNAQSRREYTFGIRALQKLLEEE